MKQNAFNTSVTSSMAKAHLFEAPTDSKLNKLVKGNPNEKLDYEFIVHPMNIILKSWTLQTICTSPQNVQAHSVLPLLEHTMKPVR